MEKRRLNLVTAENTPSSDDDVYRPEPNAREWPATTGIAVLLAEAGVAYYPDPAQEQEFRPVTRQEFKKAVPERLKGQASQVFNRVARLIGSNTTLKPGKEPGIPLKVLEVLAAPESDEPEARPRLERYRDMGPAATATLQTVIENVKNPPNNAA